MASSDSDAFESADEEFDDNFSSVDKSKEQKVVTVKSSTGQNNILTGLEVKESVHSNKEKTLEKKKEPITSEQTDNQKEIRRVNTAIEKPRWSKTECVTPPDREDCWEESLIVGNKDKKIVNVSDDKKKTELEVTNETEKILEKKNLDKLKQTDNQKEIKRVNTAIEKPRWSKTECVTPPDREECWEFDTWEESQLEKNKNVKADEILQSISNSKQFSDIKNVATDQKEKKDPMKIELIGAKQIDDQQEIRRINTAKEKPRWSKTECVTPPDREDCWEFDTWEESQIEKNKNLPEKTDKSTSSDVAAKEENVCDDGEGWDFDDWEVPSNENDNKNIDPIPSNSFPVKGAQTNFPNKDINKPNYENVLNRLTDGGSGTKQQSWSGWKPWGGVVSVLSKASEGVASLTTHVTHGISSVIESGIGVPDPEELARAQHKEESDRKLSAKDNSSLSNEVKNDEDKRESGSISFGQIVSGVTQISNKVITGGLDTLEGIGKKTMTILQDGDPMLMNKRKLLGLDNNERPVLSQILREAKEKSEENENNMKMIQKNYYKKQIHFETLFDDYHGLIHLEALEMLSKQSTLKLQSLLTPLTGKALNELQETLNEVKELCELPEQDDESDGQHSVDDLNDKLKVAVEDLSVPVDFKEILNCWDDNIKWLDNVENSKIPQDIYEKGLHCLAQTTALTVHKMHKLAEILLIQDQHSTANEVDSLVQLTTVLSWHISGIATKFSDKLSNIEKTDDINNLITSIFLEGSNSILYLQNAYTLFIPILQMGAV